MGESVDDGGADAKTSKRARARHKSNLRDVLESFALLGEFVANETEEFFGKVVA